MKQLKHFSLLLIVALSIVGACSVPIHEVQAEHTLVGGVAFDAELSRMSYSEAYGGVVKVDFEEGDKVFVSTTDGTWGSSESNPPVEFAFNATTKRFENSSAVIPVGSYTFIAEYAVESQRKYFLSESQTHKLESVQTQTSTSYAHLAKNAAMVARVNGSVVEGNNTTLSLEFKQLYSLVCFKIKNLSSRTVSPSSISIQLEGADLAGVFKVQNFDDYSIAPYALNEDIITLNLSNCEIASNATHKAYCVIAPFSGYTGDVVVKLKLSDGTTANYSVKGNNMVVPRASIYTPNIAINITDDIINQEQSGGNSLAAKSGWAELPAMIESANLEYGYHDKLPSNNKLRNYSFCFDKEHFCSIWVAYPLHSAYIGTIERDDVWAYDPCCIADEYEPNVGEGAYKIAGESSIYDRGHHLPSADRTKSDADNLSTFYATNVTPQLASLNRGKWSSLENNVRGWICSDTLYVVTGAHFEEGATLNYTYDAGGSGKRCPVPTHYFKVVLRTKSGNSGKWVANCSSSELKCVGFWFDNVSGAERQTMSVADIEQKTGLTFFPNVPNAPKAAYNASDWQ